MARSSTSAQHYVGCDNCEENPATFLCKACEGRLCEPCKINHEKKKITQNHEILPLTSKNEEMLDILLCPYHAKKKLVCYCTRCSEAVCTDCIDNSHNGHSVKSLFNVYKELEDCSKRRKEEIEKSLLPKYRNLIAKEKEKRSAFTKRADEIQTKIDAHTQRVIERVKQIGQQSVLSLRNAEKDGLKKMDKFMGSIEEKTKQLQLMNQRISANMEARPHSSMFRSNNSHDLKSFQTLPSPADYTLTDFQPQQMNLENMFGEPSVLIIGCSQKKNSFIPVTDSIKRHQNLKRTTGVLEKPLSDFSLDEGENSTKNKSRQKNNKNLIFFSPCSSSSDDEYEDELHVPYEDKACQKQRGKSHFNRKSNNGIFPDDEDDDGENKSRRKSTKKTSWFEDPFSESFSDDEDKSFLRPKKTTLKKWEEKKKRREFTFQ